MIDFEQRIADLMLFLQSEYALVPNDRPAVELLLSLIIRLPDGSPAPRVILDTDWLSRDCTGAWFALGGKIVPYSVAKLSGMRAWPARRQLESWTQDEASAGRPVVFVEPEWRAPRRWIKSQSGTGWSIAESLNDCLRIRVRAPKSLSVLQVDRDQAGARAGKLKYLVSKVVESELRLRSAPKLALPPDYGYWCEIACKVMRKESGVWEWLVEAVARIAVRNAYVHGRARTESEDWRLAGRVLGWQAAPWTAGLITRIAQGPMDNRRLSGRGWREYVHIPGTGGEWGMESAKELRVELRRLAAAGLIRMTPGHGWSAGAQPDWQNTIKLIAGHAFD